MPSWLGQRAKGISRQRGAALVIALLVMAVLLLMGTSFLSISSTEMEIARNAREAVQAFYVAEAGVARLKRDLLAQFTVPYAVPCANFDVFADLRRTDLISGEPLGVPGQQVDAERHANHGRRAHQRLPLFDHPSIIKWEEPVTVPATHLDGQSTPGQASSGARGSARNDGHRTTDSSGAA